MPVPARTEPMAQAAMGLGIASTPLALFGCCCGPIGFLGLIAGIVGVVLGIVARKNIAQSGGMKGGDKEAKVGLITGSVGIGVSLLIIVLVVVLNVANLGASSLS
jgi:hypothetical protein